MTPPVAGTSSERGDLRVVVLSSGQLGTARTGVPAAQGRCYTAFYDLASEVTEYYFSCTLLGQS